MTQTTDVQTEIAALRRDALAQAGEAVRTSREPIQVMSRIVTGLMADCRARGYPDTLIAAAIVNRTIGDIDLRRVVEHDDHCDYRTLADDLGVALPGEPIAGLTATGTRYVLLRERMQKHERALLARGVDLHMYDLGGVGNPVLRAWLSEYLAELGLAIPPAQIFLAIGSLDALDKIIRGLRMTAWHDVAHPGFVFPQPGYAVPLWQAQSAGLEIVPVRTTPETGYRMTAGDLATALAARPDARAVYLTLSNNPTACAYTPDELLAILAVLARYPAVQLFADMAYTGTGEPAEEHARLNVLAAYDHPEQICSFWSFSKVLSMTGSRFGWVAIGDPALAARLHVAWTNTLAALPAEWQLRFMAFFELVRDHPEVRVKLSALYRLRRRALIRQLDAINSELHLFDQTHAADDGTVYVWARLAPGESAFTLFEKTGIAGVPGSAFGYDDDHVRLSIGIVPVPGWEEVVAE
jgi:aspartate/methionine/tyrosine aminotransferase